MAIIKPNNNTLSSITALPAAITTGKILQVAQSVGTTIVTAASGTVITSLSFTPTSSSNKVMLFANCAQIRKADAGTGSAAAIRVYVGSTATNCKSENEGYPESESDTRGNITCVGFHDCWSGAETVSVQTNGFGSNVSYSWQNAPTTLIVMEVEQ
jgi:hypothetical protein